MPTSPICTEPLSVDHILAGFALLYGSLPPGDAVAMAAAGVQQLEGDPTLAAGLLGAFRGDELAGVIWAQPQPGRTLLLIGPAIKPTEPPTTACQLLAAARKIAVSHQASLIQALFADGDDPACQFLLEAGFEEIAQLAYLVCTSEGFPNAPPRLRCELEPYSESERERLGHLIEATYAGSLDCPALNGVRDPLDVLEGYRSGGVFFPERWLLVRQGGEDIGCLLLTDYPQFNQWELVYLGILPAARGQGFGLDLTRHAQWLAGQAGRGKLVLAVDEANAPALRAYQAAGFVVWNRRLVLCQRVC